MSNFLKLLDKVSEKGYSDIHICEDKKISIRKSNGNIEKIEFILDKDEIFGFANNINSPDQIDNLLNGEEIDNAYTYNGKRYRINIYNDINGINMALRQIPQDIANMEDLGIPNHIKNSLKKTKGLILVTGPTGSGKTTTVVSLLNYINKNMSKHIITLEDPIEFIYKEEKSLINQRNVGKNTKSWTNGIKYSLRQDPDVIMVGEMRDLETIQSVLTLVETGHLVISTLHTSSGPQTISRIINAFPQGKQNMIATQLSLSLELIISQKLIERKDIEDRIAAREILIGNDAISNLIRENKIGQIFSVLETGAKKGMNTMDKSLAELVATDKITLKCAMPHVKNQQIFKELVQFYKNK